MAREGESLEKVFVAFDANKDGALSWEEIWTSMEPLYKDIETKNFKWSLKPTMNTEEFEEMVKEMF